MRTVDHTKCTAGPSRDMLDKEYISVNPFASHILLLDPDVGSRGAVGPGF
jgi:hypothetical protein